VEVAESDVTIDAGQDTKPLTLAQRLAAIRAESSGVGKENVTVKTKGGDQYSFQAHTIEGVLHGLRVLLDRHRVWVNPNLVDVKYNGNRCDVIVDFIWENLDDANDTRTIRWAGSDTDHGGKGFAKAGTNALKEMLKKTFFITDREDAKEETEVVEHMTDDGIKRAQVEKEAEKARKTQQLWLSSHKKAVETAGTSDGVKALKRENSEQMAGMPTVTRGFFDDLYRDRMAALEAIENKEAQEALE
jgi:hypothetical protein